MQRLLEACVSYAKKRRQFGKPIGKFQSISNKITDMKTNIELGKLILYKAAWLKDQKKRATLETSLAKLFISEKLKSLCLEAVQIHGAYGIMKEAELERDLRDSIAATIYSGTSEIQKNIISAIAGL
jgi:alkylation response protein AidB-like acyl-CoA dehydrogenase